MSPAHADAILTAWRGSLEALAGTESPGDLPAQLACLLQGLPAIAAGGVRAETGEVLTLARVIDGALAADWAGRQVEGRPFLLELARRALALGHRDGGR